MYQNFYSQQITFGAGSRVNVPLDFVERRGINGGRLVIEKVEIEVYADFTTGGGVSLAAADLHTILGRLELKDAGGYRVDLSGEQIKLFAQADLRYRMPAAPAAVAASTTNGLRTIRFPIQYKHILDYAPGDCRLPTDDLLNGGQVAITWPATASLPWAGGTGTINTGTYAIVNVHCVEVYDLVLYTRDERKALLQDSVAVVRIPVDGNLLAQAFLHQGSIAGGGGSLAGITLVDFRTLGQTGMNPITLRNLHLEEGGVVYTTAEDLVLGNIALPLIVENERAKMKDRPRINGTLLGQLTTTESVLASQVFRLITPKDRRVTQAALTVNGVGGAPETTVKTEAKTVKDTAAWGGAVAFMPEKVKQ